MHKYDVFVPMSVPDSDAAPGTGDKQPKQPTEKGALVRLIVLSAPPCFYHSSSSCALGKSYWRGERCSCEGR